MSGAGFNGRRGRIPAHIGPFSLLSFWLAWRAERNFRRLRVPAGDLTGSLPALSIIVPARNEVGNLARLLPALRALDYPGPCEIIVVDDGSVDDTSAVATRHGARLVRLDALPPGWHGKPHACHQGAVLARGDWLLFTDADTWHAPASAASAVAHAQRVGLDGLSLYLGQETGGTWDRVALLVAFAGLFAGLQRRTPMLNGQYILLRRAVYHQSGGFAAVRDEAVEDLALAHWLHRQGFRVPMLQGETLATVRMYRDRAQLWQGLTRLSAGALPWAGPGRWLSAAFITLGMMPLISLGLTLAGRLPVRWLAVHYVSAVLSFAPWRRRFGAGWQLGLAPLGALMVQVAGSWGLLRRLTGRGIRWKDRLV